MPDLVRFYPECHADTALIIFLVQNSELIEHAAGINEVAKSLETAKSDTVRLIGIIDNDKHKPRYFCQFETIKEENKICFLHKPDTNQFLLIIDKAIESFLLWNAEQVGVNVADYGFSPDVKRFGNKLKSVNIETDPNYIQLLADLHAQNAPGIITLQTLLHELFPTH